jgi:hypothetical protein
MDESRLLYDIKRGEVKVIPARSDKDADRVKPWQERVDPAYSVYKKFTAAQQEIAELRALLAAQSTHAGEAQAEVERLKAGWGEAFKLAVEWQGRAIRAEELQAERAPSGEAPARTFGDLAALLPGEFMWGDALQAATLCEILGAYDAQRATADNAAPTEADCHPTCGYIGADCNYPACKLSFASNAATAAPGDLPIFCYAKQVHPGWPEFNKQDEFSDGEGDGEALVKLSDVQACIASNAGTALGWISVEDRMPEFKHECTTSGCDVSDTVLVYGESEFGTNGCGFGHARDDGTWVNYEAEYDQLTVAKVTHWTPLPAAPSNNSPLGAKEKDK